MKNIKIALEQGFHDFGKEPTIEVTELEAARLVASGLVEIKAGRHQTACSEILILARKRGA